jgi:hypothetical protein
MAYQQNNYALLVLHFIALLFALCVTIATMSMVVSSDDKRTPFHITNTILSKYDSESPINTYIPVSKPPSIDQFQETFYTCLMYAEVAVDDTYKCPKDNLDVYKTCLNGLISPTFRVQRMISSVRQIIAEYDGKSVDVTQLPAVFTSVDTITTLPTVLASNSSRFAIKQQLAAQSTSLSIRLLEAVIASETMTGIPTCLDQTKTRFLTEYSANYDLSTAFDSMWKCTSDVILIQHVQKRAYEKCIPLSAWPAKDIMQNPYSDTLLGSYNKYFVLWIGVWLLTSFAVYTSPGLSSPATDNGKPKFFTARAGKGLVSFSLVWNLAAVIIVLIRTFTSADSFNDAPMSIQTALVTLFFTISASIYFGREVYELFYLSDRPPEFKFKGTSTKVSAALNQRRHNGGRVYQGISAFMETSGYTQDIPDEEYTPLVAPVWNDAWFFTDALLFLAVAGTSYDTVTADIVICVFCILSAALCNSALVRLMYEGYVNDKNKPKPAQAPQVVQSLNESLFVIRVMAIIASITALFFSIIVSILVFMRFGSKLISLYCILTSLLPQVFWLLLVLVMDYGQVNTLRGFFDVTSSTFGVNVIIRMAFVSTLLYYFNYDYNSTVGDSDSLLKLLSYLNTESVATPSYI